MKKISVLAILVLVLSLMLAISAVAVTIDEVGDPGSTYWDSSAQAIAAKARNGASGNNNDVAGRYAIGLGYTTLSTFGSGSLQVAIVPNTSPFWTYNQPYHFTLTYVSQDPTYLNETVFTITDPTSNNQVGLVGDTLGSGNIYTIRLNYTGNGNPLVASGAVNISNLTLNNSIMGPNGTYYSGFTDNFVYFRYSDGTPFTSTFTIAGDFVFTSNGGAPNFPGFEFDLSAQPVPLPPSVLLLGSGLLGLGALGWRRKRAK